jgi:hypothetical protein
MKRQEELGIVRHRVKHPARPRIGFPDADQSLIENTAKDDLKAILANSRGTP